MKKFSKSLAAAGLLAAGLAVTAQVHAATWSDTFIGYRYGTEFTEPGNANDIEKHVLVLGHASGYAYGQNFFNLDILQSDEKDQAAGNNGVGATEFYLSYRHQVHLSKVFEGNFGFGPVKETAISAGFDLNSKNTGFAPRKRMLVVGPTFKMDVPGFLDVSLFAAYETGHCGLGFCTDKEVTFDPYLMLNLAWGTPFEVAGVPLRFQGFANFITSKGENNSGAETKSEILIRPALMVDVGRYLLKKDNTLRAGIGYEYWRNKFGNPSGNGIDTDTFTLNAQWHF